MAAARRARSSHNQSSISMMMVASRTNGAATKRLKNLPFERLLVFASLIVFTVKNYLNLTLALRRKPAFAWKTSPTLQPACGLGNQAGNGSATLSSVAVERAFWAFVKRFCESPFLSL